MKIAVIGAGIFGITIAHKISSLGKVDLFDKNNTILSAASHANQLRLHRGYHYPRSPETVESLITSIELFRQDYAEAVVDCNEHYYAISKNDSLVTREQYISFCEKFNLEHVEVKDHPLINKASVSLVIKAKEASIDYDALKKLCAEKINKANVTTKLNHCFTREMMLQYDYVINCTYSSINDLSNNTKDYQFEVCEKILVDLPDAVKQQSIVIMDGPFMCVDPYGRTSHHLLGNVVHAIHATNTGKTPNVPKELKSYLDAGIVKNPSITNFKQFIDAGATYVPELRNARHVGSLYTVRAVLPKLEKTDARPTIVSREDQKLINVFSGKIDTCSHAARQVLDIISEIV